MVLSSYVPCYNTTFERYDALLVITTIQKLRMNLKRSQENNRRNNSLILFGTGSRCVPLSNTRKALRKFKKHNE